MYGTKICTQLKITLIYNDYDYTCINFKKLVSQGFQLSIYNDHQEIVTGNNMYQRFEKKMRAIKPRVQKALP